MMKLALPVIALCLLASSPAALAEPRTHSEAKVTIDVPTGWKVDAGEDHMTITDPKEEIALFLIVLEAKDLDKAIKAMEKEVGKAVKDVEWDGEPQELKLNGMDAIALDGKGKIEGTDADLGVLLVVTPAGKVLLVLGAVESARAKAHEKTLEKLLKSIKPVK